MKSSQSDTENDDVKKKQIKITCELKSSAAAAILKIEKQVKNLKSKVDEIVNLLKKPSSGNKIVAHSSFAFHD